MKELAVAMLVACAPAKSVPQPEVHDDGAELARKYACTSCHAADQRLVGPRWRGLYGSQVALADQRTVTADEDYIVRAIFDPNADVVASYAPVMPSFRNTISERQARALARYIATLR